CANPCQSLPVPGRRKHEHARIRGSGSQSLLDYAQPLVRGLATKPHIKTPVSKLITAVLFFLACSPDNKGPLSFETPAGWTVQHKKSKGIHSYILAAPTILEGQLEFSEWPAPGKPEDMPAIIGRVTTSFLQQARATSAFRVASEDYHIEHFAGERC